MTFTIILPIEERAYAKAQVEFLSMHKLPEDLRIILTTVIKPVVLRDYGYAIPHNFFENLAQEERRWATNLLEDTERDLKKHFPNLTVEKYIEFGSPAPEILELAKKEAAKWIIVGSHGRTGLDKFFLGSVSQAVVNRAGCSVSVVRIPEADKKSEEENKEQAAAV